MLVLAAVDGADAGDDFAGVGRGGSGRRGRRRLGAGRLLGRTPPAAVAADVDAPAPDAYFFLTSAAFSFAVAITPMTAPTGTFSPSFTTIAASVPDSNASISIVALSVSISAMMSPALTLSPSFLSHFTTVPSVIVSLCWGMVISAGMGILRCC